MNARSRKISWIFFLSVNQSDLCLLMHYVIMRCEVFDCEHSPFCADVRQDQPMCPCSTKSPQFRLRPNSIACTFHSRRGPTVLILTALCPNCEKNYFYFATESTSSNSERSDELFVQIIRGSRYERIQEHLEHLHEICDRV